MIKALHAHTEMHNYVSSRFLFILINFEVMWNIGNSVLMQQLILLHVTICF